MFGVSYGELFLILGATAALIGPKDLPVIARTAGRLVGRAIGYVQVARGQFDAVMQQSQATQVHKELQEAMSQIEAIRYEIRGISIMNSAPFTRKLDAGADPPPNNVNTLNNNDHGFGRISGDVTKMVHKGFSSVDTVSLKLHNQATAFARIAEAPNVKSHLLEKRNCDGEGLELDLEKDGLLAVLPVSAENAGFLPKRSGEPAGSDIMLEAILEAEVAHKAKEFFSQPENQIPQEVPKE